MIRSSAGKLPNSDAGLAVYQRSYVASLTEALEESFEACWCAMGDQDFWRACKGFIGEYPSLSYNLSHYGNEFPSFLRNWDPELPFLEDLATLELAFRRLFHCQTPKPSKVDLSKNFTLSFGNTAFLQSSQFRVYELWRLRDTDSPPDFTWDRGEKILMFKSCDQIFTKILPSWQFEFLDLLRHEHDWSLALKEASKHSDFEHSQVERFFKFICENQIVKASFR